MNEMGYRTDRPTASHISTGWVWGISNSPPTLIGMGHQWTENTNIGCNQRLSLAKLALKVPPIDRNRSLVACTNMCGECITSQSSGLQKSYRVFHMKESIYGKCLQLLKKKLKEYNMEPVGLGTHQGSFWTDGAQKSPRPLSLDHPHGHQCFPFQINVKRGALATTVGATKPHMDDYMHFRPNRVHISSNFYWFHPLSMILRGFMASSFVNNGKKSHSLIIFYFYIRELALGCQIWKH